MEVIKIDRILNVNSETQGHEAKNLLQLQVGREKSWLAEKGTEKAVVIMKLERAAVLSKLDVGNAHSAFIEVLVGRASDSSDQFQTLIPTSTYMSPNESKMGENKNQVRFFTTTDFEPDAVGKQWDLVKVVCSQPFDKHVPYGLCFVTVHGEAKPGGGLPLKPVQEVDVSPGSFFSLWKQTKKDADKNVSISEKMRDAEKPEALARHTPLSVGRVSSKMEEKHSSTPKSKQKTSAVETSDNRKNRDIGLEDDDDEPSSKKPKQDGPGSSKRDDDERKDRRKDDDDQRRKDREDRHKRNYDDDRKDRHRDDDDRKRDRHRDDDDRKRDRHRDDEERRRDDRRKRDDDEQRRKDREDRRKRDDEEQRKKDREERRRREDEKERQKDKRKDDDDRRRRDRDERDRKEKDRRRKEEESKKDKASAKVSSSRREIRAFDKLMDGVVFVLSGYQNPERGEYRSHALAMGAKYCQDWRDGYCTHLIASYINTPKCNQVRGKGKIVSKDWIEKCYNDKKRYPWRRFALDKNEKKSPESEDEIDAGTPQNAVADVVVPAADEPSTSSSRLSPHTQPKPRARPSAADSQAENDPDKEEKSYYDAATDGEDSDEESANIPSLPSYFSGQSFFVDETIADRSVLERYIIAYDGIICEKLNEDVNYYITLQRGAVLQVVKGKLKNVEAVSPTWVQAVNCSQKFVPATDFIVN